MAKTIIKYPRFRVIQNLKGYYCLTKFDVLKKVYVDIPSSEWSNIEEAQEYADELNREHGIIEIEVENEDLKD